MIGEFSGSQSSPAQVYLGEVFTDEQGRLVVLGGRGDSHHVGSKDPYPLLTTDFDNADWVDDTSDGWVDAVVQRNGATWRPEFRCVPPFSSSLLLLQRPFFFFFFFSGLGSSVVPPSSPPGSTRPLPSTTSSRTSWRRKGVVPKGTSTMLAQSTTPPTSPLLLRPTLLAYVNGQASSTSCPG